MSRPLMPLPPGRLQPRRFAVVRSACLGALCALAWLLSLDAVPARTRAQALPEPQSIDPGYLINPTPRAERPAPPTLDSSPRKTAEPPAIDPSSVTPPSPRTMASDNPALDKEMQKLRAIASGVTSGPGSTRRPAPGRSARNATAAREATWLLGLLALHGIGMPTDAVQAHQWFEMAQALGHPEAPAGLAWCELDGCAHPPNPAAARQWIAQLRKTDTGRAMYLEWLLQTRMAPLQNPRPSAPQGSPPGPDPTPDQDLLQLAAQAGSTGAMVELGMADLSAGRLAQALEQFRAAAPRSAAAASNAQLLSSRLQAEARQLPQRRSAEQWFAEAQRYHRGEGIPANYTEAIRLYQIAAASGSRPAKRMLELIYSRPSSGGGIHIEWMQQLANINVTREGAMLSILPPPSPQPFVRDPTPLYDLLPSIWRAAQHNAPRQ